MERLKILRGEAGLKQVEVASRLGIDRTTYVKYETGASEPNQEMLVKLSRLFGASIDYILGVSDEKKPPVKDERQVADEKEAKAKIADELYDRLTPENRAKADSYLNYLLAEQAAREEKQ